MGNGLVTGGAGFIGTNCIDQLLETRVGVRVITLDALTYARHRENLHPLQENPRQIFIQGYIHYVPPLDHIFEEYRMDTVVHFAAETHGDHSIHNPNAFVQTNVLGTFLLLEVARQAWLEWPGKAAEEYTIHHVSTDEVCGSLAPDAPASTENSACDLCSPYSASRADDDHLACANFHSFGLPVTVTQHSNNDGPRQFPKKFIPQMVLNAVYGKPLPLYGVSRQIRNWSYVTDYCTAILKVLKRGRIGQTCHVGGGNQTVNIDALQTLCDLLDRHLPRQLKEDPVR